MCHPSLCDDNLSGIAVSAALARRLLDGPPPRHTFRFLFAPGTIGAITWLARNREHGRPDPPRPHAHVPRRRPPVHLQAHRRRGDAAIDRAAAHVLAQRSADNQLIDFFPYGYDERQFNSPGSACPSGR